MFATSALLNAVDWKLNGGALRPNELRMRTRLGSAADAVLTKNNGIAAAMETTKRNPAPRRRQISRNCKSNVRPLMLEGCEKSCLEIQCIPFETLRRVCL